MRERVAAGFDSGEAIRERREMKTVVLPEPVGRETPMRETPEDKALAHASRHLSWYGRKTTGCSAELDKLREDCRTVCSAEYGQTHRICVDVDERL